MTDKGIYQIRCSATGRIYIGASTNVLRRWEIHRRDLRCGRHSATLMQDDWDAHGADSFAVTLLERVEGEHDHRFSDREREWIAKLRPEYNRKMGTWSMKHPDRVTSGISMMLTPQLAAFVRARAEEFGATPSEWLRSVIQEMFEDHQSHSQGENNS
jgi:group I intron endonuclease